MHRVNLKTAERCKSWAQPDADRCNRHARTVGKVPSLPRRVCAATKNDGTPCPTWAKRGDDLCAIHARKRDGLYVGNPNRKHATVADAARCRVPVGSAVAYPGDPRGDRSAPPGTCTLYKAAPVLDTVRGMTAEMVDYLEAITDDDRARLRARLWALDGACRGKDTDTWYPERGEAADPARGRVRRVSGARPVPRVRVHRRREVRHLGRRCPRSNAAASAPNCGPARSTLTKNPRRNRSHDRDH